VKTWICTSPTAVVLFCTKLQPRKRPFDLLNEFAKAAELQAQAAALGVAERVRFLGFANQTQLPAIYSAAQADGCAIGM
jgi:glycosyltransferase involved in cell wall biosynthesis